VDKFDDVADDVGITEDVESRTVSPTMSSHRRCRVVTDDVKIIPSWGDIVCDQCLRVLEEDLQEGHVQDTANAV
jgi:hypothetical protein